MWIHSRKRGVFNDNYNASGSYRVEQISGTMAAGLAANSPIVSFRWADTSNIAIVTGLRMQMSSLGTGFTAGIGQFNLFFARAFSVADTGGTTVTLGGNVGKLGTVMGTTLLTELRYSQTATLTAGTRTKDARPLAAQWFQVGTGTNTIMLPKTEILYPGGFMFEPAHPVCLVTQEGLIVEATVPATGTWQFSVEIEWFEMTNTVVTAG